MEGNSFALKQAARLAEWKAWINGFISDRDDTELIPHAAELLNDYYWRLIIAYLKPLLEYGSSEEEHNIHYYKIISASEITVMSVLPFKRTGNNDPMDRKQLNAEFACFVAYFIIGNWTIKGINYIDPLKLREVLLFEELIDKIGDEDKFYPQSLMDEHIEWLKDLNTAGALPVLSNAQTWRAIFLASRADK